MAFREVSVVVVREILRLWLAGDGYRSIARLALVDRRCARRYVQAAIAAGLDRGRGEEQLTEELLAAVVAAVPPGRPPGNRGKSWQVLLTHKTFITERLDKGLTVVRIERDLRRHKGVEVASRSLYRFCEVECDTAAKRTTVRISDPEPGSELQVDFGRMGLLHDLETDRRRVCHALVFTAACSRHMFVWLTFSQALPAVIEGFEAAWAFFGGVFKVVIPDNLKAIVDKSDPLNPRLNEAFVEYAQARGFHIDAARARHPKDKARVERSVGYVRKSFFAGEEFRSLDDARRAAEQWCLHTAGLRIHGTTCRRPREVFRAEEAQALLPAPESPYDLPLYASPKVHRDYHIEVDKALYSVPAPFIGLNVKIRADRHLVRIYHHGVLIKTHPRTAPGKRCTDEEDLPLEKAAYAMRDLERLKNAAAAHGPSVGALAAAILEGPLPWTRMRRVYRLLGLVRRYGAEGVEAACAKAMELEAAEAWDESSAVSFDRELWAELTTLRFCEEAHNVLVMGPVGVGKTHLASALGHIACRRRRSVAFHRTDRLLKHLKAARLGAAYEAEMRKLIRVDLLILDDFCLHALDATETSDVYEIVVERHLRSSTVVTSNREPQEWLQVMADALLTQSAIDRLQSAAYELVVEGDLPPTPEARKEAFVSERSRGHLPLPASRTGLRSRYRARFFRGGSERRCMPFVEPLRSP
jgi:transposase